MKKCKIIVFSDIHYLNEISNQADFDLRRKLTHYSIPLLEELIDRINNVYNPDVSINLGDLIQDTCNHDEDIKNLNYIWNILKKIKTPFYSAIGNHDLRMMNSRKEVEKIMGYEHSTFSINVGGYHLVILGTEIRQEFGVESGGIFKTQFVSDEDIRWLRRDLASNNLPCVVFTHFGLAEDSMEGNYWFQKTPECALLRNRESIKRILKNDENIVAVFSGHQHWTKMKEEDGVKYYVIGSLTENINDDGVPDGVFFEVELENKDIKVIEHHILM